MKSDSAVQISRSGSAGGESQKLPPAFCWLHRVCCIRDFLLLYRDQAVTEKNVWAEAHLDGLITNVAVLEKRARLAVEQEIWTGSKTSVPSCAEEVKIKIKQ